MFSLCLDVLPPNICFSHFCSCIQYLVLLPVCSFLGTVLFMFPTLGMYDRHLAPNSPIWCSCDFSFPQNCMFLVIFTYYLQYIMFQSNLLKPFLYKLWLFLLCESHIFLLCFCQMRLKLHFHRYQFHFQNFNFSVLCFVTVVYQYLMPHKKLEEIKTQKRKGEKVSVIFQQLFPSTVFILIRI